MVPRLLILALALTGCLKKLPAFACADDSQCGAGGVCEANGLCSFADADCPSGRRFGDQQGDQSNQCVGAIVPTDGPVTDAPVDMMNCPGDLDCDNVADGADNCPTVANENQFNEDNDPRGDACDKCPPFDDNNEDADGDGVGDDCDPHPGQPDTLVEFAGFEEMPAGWIASGSVTITNGTAVLAADITPVRLTRASPPGTHHTIWAEAKLDSIDPAGPLGAVGVAVQHAPGGDEHGGLCQIVGTPAGGQQELRLFNTGGGSNNLLDSTGHPFTAGLTFELYLEREGTSLSCDASNPDASISGNSSFAPANPEVNLRTRSATGSYRWVMVISTP